ncbi:MAG: nucleotidyltransferase family protein [bacterium]|nr:nucleotidyltransferase family protein [bacterium]
MSRQLDPATAAELVAVADALGSAGIDFFLGGSALLVLSGIDVPVGDLDFYTDQPDAGEVVAALIGWQCEVRSGGPEPWRSGWVLHADRGRGVSVDMIGNLAVMIDGELAQFRVAPATLVEIAGRAIPLAPVAQWYHLYRVHNPTRAARIAALVGHAELGAAAEALGIVWRTHGD